MITLFHGSYVAVSTPLVKLGRQKVDFGQGFYLTKLRQLGQLRYKKVNHQICILNQDIVYNYLTFFSSESIKLDE